MSNFPNVFDKNGLAVITGGASGFGYETSKRLSMVCQLLY